MKELEQQTKAAKEVTIPSPTEHKYLGTMRKINGLTVWKCNLATMEIAKAEFEKEEATFEMAKLQAGTRRKIVREQNHIYCQALNMKNAEKKFAKEINYRLAMARVQKAQNESNR
jgi:hypothetical protein